VSTRVRTAPASTPVPALERARRAGAKTLSAGLAPWDWPLRTKLVIALLVPGLLAVVLGSLRIADQRAQAAELDRVARFVTVHDDIAGLIERLQVERLRATLYVAGGRRGDADGVRAAAADVDAVRDRVRTAVEGLFTDDSALVPASIQAQQALDRLPGQRVLALTSNAPASAVVSRYSDIVEQLVELDGVVLRGVNPTQVSGLATALTGLDAARDEASLQQALLGTAAPGRPLAPAVAADVQSAEARLVEALRGFRVALDPGQRVRYAGLVADAVNTSRAQLVRGVAAPGGTQPDLAQSQPLYDAFIGQLDQAQAGVGNELAATSAQRRQAAANAAWLNVGLLALALLVGAAVVILIARQMVGQLRALRESALHIARVRLPQTVARMRQGAAPTPEVEPVPVRTREDIGQVARAFDAVHSQAVRLAAEQAGLQTNVNAMYVNLSRRSQTLIDRQLRLIESLEQDEQDPDQLETLFQLDHLATRMRRNCENLLVLAGARFGGGVGNVSVREVIQAAVSETDQYRRIDVRSLPPAVFVGRVSKDLWHLLAELLDNATNFSPPDSRVTVSGGPGANGGVVLRIEDRGIGMSPEDLAAANQRLSRPADATAETARRMGLFVVGQLARRHGIGVLLQANERHPDAGPEPAGLTVLVSIPPALMHQPDQPPAPAGPPPGLAGPPPMVPFPRAEQAAPPARPAAAMVPLAPAPPAARPPDARPPVVPPARRPPRTAPDRHPVPMAAAAPPAARAVPEDGTAGEAGAWTSSGGSTWFGAMRIPPYASTIHVQPPPNGTAPAPPPGPAPEQQAPERGQEPPPGPERRA
jgi:signal transduction histidine kinase